MKYPTKRAPKLVGSRLNLSLAISAYDHARDLTSGQIEPEGILLTSLILPIEEIAFRWLRNFEFDAAETSFAKFITLIAAGDSPIVGLPVFLARVFRHSAIYVRRDSVIADPKDLEGKTVGIPEWAQTAGVYVRGMLTEYYGVALDRVSWRQAGVNEAGRAEKVSLNLPSQFDYRSCPDKSIDEMLLTGEIDAAITARPPRSFSAGDARVRRLFPDFRNEEQNYFRATQIFPIMHIVAMRREVFDIYPWAARNLLTAFERAKDASVARIADVTTSQIPLPWGAALSAEMSEAMGGQTWPYGVEANRTTLDAFCRFAHEQYLTARLLTPDQLFPKEVIASSRV